MPRYTSLPFTRQRTKGGTFLFRFQLPADVFDALVLAGHAEVPRTLLMTLRTTDPTAARGRALKAAANAFEIVRAVRAGDVESAAALLAQRRSRDGSLHNCGVEQIQHPSNGQGTSTGTGTGHASGKKRRSGPQQTLSWVYENVYLPRRTERKGAPPRRRSRLDLEAGIDRFVALVGDKDIRDVSRRDAEQFVGSLNLPSVGTTKKAIGVLSTLFNCAVERELIGKNPFRGLGPDRYTVVAARRSYRRFDADQLSRIFCRTEMKSGSMLWVPRLLLLTGARLEEMAQLRAAWFTVRDRVHVIDLHAARVKTPHSRRYVPLHRHLLELGLLDYVASANDRLFPKLQYRRTAERWGASLSTRLNREIDEAVGRDRTLTVHSLRKTFEHAAYVAGVPKPTFNAITGHKAGDISEEHYLQLQDDVGLLKRQLDTLDFSFLFPALRQATPPTSGGVTGL